jgi:Tfp pilus assembly protein PilO
VNNYGVQELNEMEFAILTVMMLLITGVLMCYVGYMNSIKKDHLQQQLELVEEEIDKCEYHYRLKKLIALRRKLKKKMDNY